MNILVNHCWCSDSNWGGVFHCRVILSIPRIPNGKTYYDAPCEDWANLVEKSGETFRLKPEVMAWLSKNIPDKNGEKRWAVGSDTYNENSALAFPLFFEVQKDAKRFTKEWSVFKKPKEIFNYFTGKRYILVSP